MGRRRAAIGGQTNAVAGLTRDQLLEMIERGQSLMVEAASRLPAASDATISGQAVKDSVAQLSLLMLEMADAVDALRAKRQPRHIEDRDAYNDARAAADRDLPWPEVNKRARLAEERLKSAVAACGEDLLASEALVPGRTQPQLLWRSVLQTGYGQVVGRLCDSLLKEGALDQARAVHVRCVDDSLTVAGEKSRPYAVALYNLACFDALYGNPESAMQLLREALAQHPELRMSTAQDPDLRALRGRPDFEALLAG